MGQPCTPVPFGLRPHSPPSLWGNSLGYLFNVGMVSYVGMNKYATIVNR